MSVAVLTDAELNGYLVWALKIVTEHCRVNGVSLPDPLSDLLVALSVPERTNNDDDDDMQEAESMQLLLSYSEAARRLGLGEKTVRRLAQKGALATVSIGRRKFVRPTDLESYIAGLGGGKG